MYTVHIDILVLWRAEAHQSIKHVDVCRIHGKTNVIWWQRIKTITLRWSCTQYSMNMHLRQSPWAHTQATRLRTLMTREDHSRSHESPSYKVHNHPYYIMHNATTQSGKVNQILPTFQGYGLPRHRKSKGGSWRGTLIHALEKRLNEGDRRT